MSLSSSELDNGFVKVTSDPKYDTDETMGQMQDMMGHSMTFDNRMHDEFGNPIEHGFAGPRTGRSDRR
jgi:hypothetical protein